MYQWHFLPWLQVRFDDTLVSQERVLEAIEDAGFEAQLLSSSSATPGAKVCFTFSCTAALDLLVCIVSA